ncbi:family 2 glycosyl transferase [Gordoniibacillus kamchatkensis]|uniref:Family 2 glycosyl transferase n=1 Tax=Gordoniibacillus kamchatkensis TaxID=1590651 RepID=A0ABR5AIU0_9BACL|nr:glycosyltransferase family 2 protein [Paenibacillus sp. VKM B-2647]KIL40653.1 family 2 glycosyl transferase [Paenibacillus sp. VKM B-2647]
MTTFSVCLIVRNEETNIRRVLASVPKHVEIVVGDTGSQDNTKKIASAMGAKVVDVEWNGSFADARNGTAAYATGDYILFLDADEELDSGALTAMRKFAKHHPDQAGAITIRNLIEDEIHIHSMARFYPNNGKYRYAGVVHEMIYYGDTPALSAKTGIIVTHYGYQQEEYERKGKAKRYFELYEQHLRQHPDDGYMLYQLGKLHFSLKQYEEAVLALNRCIALHEEQQLYFPVMAVMLGYALKYIGRSAEAETRLTPYIARYPTFPDLPFLLGLLAMDSGKLPDIENYFRMALAIGDNDNYASVVGTGSFKAAYNLGVFYEITGQLEPARKYYQLASRYGYSPAKQRLQIIKQRL